LACTPLGCLWKLNPPLLPLFRTQPLGKGAQSLADCVGPTALQAPVVALHPHEEIFELKPALWMRTGPAHHARLTRASEASRMVRSLCTCAGCLKAWPAPRQQGPKPLGALCPMSWHAHRPGHTAQHAPSCHTGFSRQGALALWSDQRPLQPPGPWHKGKPALHPDCMGGRDSRVTWRHSNGFSGLMGRP
jgi:hypothetical protein